MGRVGAAFLIQLLWDRLLQGRRAVSGTLNQISVSDQGLGGLFGGLGVCWKSAMAFEEMNEEGLQVGACPELRLMSQ